MNIIDGLQKKTIRRLEILITTIGWLVMLFYIIQTLLSIGKNIGSYSYPQVP